MIDKTGRIFLVQLETVSPGKHGLPSPIFPSGRFELIPPVGNTAFACMPIFDDLLSWNSPDSLLSEIGFVPRAALLNPADLNPDFEHFTYIAHKNKPDRTLRHVRPGDWLLFLAELTPFTVENCFSQNSGYFLVGALQVELALDTLKHPVDIFYPGCRPFSNHVYYLQAVEEGRTQLDHLICIAGVQQAFWQRFDHAVPFTRQIIYELNLLDKQGNPWNWTVNNQSEVNRIKSYTRSPRPHLSFDKEEDEERIRNLWNVIRTYNPDVPEPWRGQELDLPN